MKTIFHNGILALLAGMIFALVSSGTASAAACENITIIQNGSEISAAGGEFRLKRQAFTVRYNGGGKSPSITLSSSPQLNLQLNRLAQPLLIGSAGDYMALYPNDMILVNEFSFFDTADGRREFAQIIGDGYPELLENIVAGNYGAKTTVSVSRANSGFAEGPTGQYDYRIVSINEKPLQQSGYERLFLTLFTVREKLGIEKEAEMKLLELLEWSDCSLSFR